jgi:hypothetical protein
MASTQKVAIEFLAVWIIGTALLLVVITRQVDDSVSAVSLGVLASVLWLKVVGLHFAPAMERAEEHEQAARFLAYKAQREREKLEKMI